MATKIDRAVCLNVDKRYAEQGRIREDFSRVGIAVEFFLAGDGKLVDAPYDHIDDQNPPPREGDYPAWINRHNSWWAFQAFLAIIKKADADGVDTLLLLEDDAYPTSEFTNALPAAWESLHAIDPNWHSLALGANHTFSRTTPVGRHLLRLNGSGCWHGIVLHRRVFPLVYALPAKGPIDGMFAQCVHPLGRSYGVWPNIVWVLPNFSECEGRVVDYTHMAAPRGC